MGEPLGNILHRIPLSERAHDAIVMRTGPYAPSLEMACALETNDASAIRQLCETHELDQEEINRALLRVLANLEVVRHPGH
jgi:c-di-GMP-related signal transduction protein